MGTQRIVWARPVWSRKGGRPRDGDQTAAVALQRLGGRCGEQTSGQGRVACVREASWHIQGQNWGRNRPKLEGFAVPQHQRTDGML